MLAIEHLAPQTAQQKTVQLFNQSTSIIRNSFQLKEGREGYEKQRKNSIVLFDIL